ncbi:MAG: FecR family protein [Polaromonas sp.]|uniref:FecR family protein n=1 Tax=Polaromonas sp. TaxID=1869339 RepID=UPI00403704AD
METAFRLKNTVLLMALAAAYPLQAHALAGIAQFTAGEVNLRQTDGRVTALTKGGDINSGHAIVTGNNGRAQVKFTDGGLISLQPNTEFKIANYVDQNDPKQDRFLVDLLRGSMRAITGLIGKRNRDNYKLTTTTATIGIRGSGFKVGYNPDGTLGITSELDKIEVCNQSGCIGLVAGESVRVIDSATPPVRTSEQPKVDTPPAEKDPVVVGDKVNDSGKAEIVETVKPVTTKADPVQRTFTNIAVTALGTSGGSPYTLNTAPGATTVFSDNKLLSVDNNVGGGFGKWSETGTPGPASDFKSVGNVTDANFIGWGTWVAGQREYLGTTMLNHVHYVTGRPTAAAEMSALMLGGGTATYTLIGSTTPIRSGAAGTLTGASLSVNFSSTQYVVNASVNTSFGTIADSITVNSTSSTFSGTYMNGALIGTNAGLAGLTYAKDLGAGMITGAAVFQK